MKGFLFSFLHTDKEYIWRAYIRENARDSVSWEKAKESVPITNDI